MVDGNDVTTWVHWVFEGIVTVLATIIWWLWNRLADRLDGADGRVDGVENMVQKIRLDQKDGLAALQNLRLHVSENYASKPETNASIARVHEKIEKLNDDVVRHIENLRQDIREDIRDAVNCIRKE
jgi:hypothetical protein